MAIDPRQKELWLREFRLNGFVILRNFLPVELVESMHEELAPLLEAEHARAEKDGYAKGRGRGRLSLRIADYADMFQGALADDRYRKNPVIEELVDEILGAGRWRRAWTVVEAVFRGAEHMTWHSDQTPEETPDLDAPHETIRVIYNIPLVEFTPETGAMEILPGSHMQTRRFLDGQDTEDLAHVWPVSLPLALGDALLRDGNGLHRGTPNVSDRVRPMLDQTYKRV